MADCVCGVVRVILVYVTVTSLSLVSGNSYGRYLNLGEVIEAIVRNGSTVVTGKDLVARSNDTVVTETCLKDLLLMSEGIRNESSWALKSKHTT